MKRSGPVFIPVNIIFEESNVKLLKQDPDEFKPSNCHLQSPIFKDKYLILSCIM